MRQFKQWMKQSTRAQKQRLAKLAGGNYMYLYQMLSGDRDAGSKFAAALEKASRKMDVALPVLTRGDVCKVCADCPYYKKCKKDS
jgi:hypothetical protein